MPMQIVIHAKISDQDWQALRPVLTNARTQLDNSLTGGPVRGLFLDASPTIALGSLGESIMEITSESL